ncbi:hypothetical protein R3W88_020102 [Solanum pinnatisectum]|uniref:Uncharacterized protein n=1 Tax=Solanum pinnatisectum TaxID=50273 RepID=A0AAV9KNG8_9SOLN|nr:hypothetical protein R3W88_020102 [Solanum pinnatisectum]
MRKCLLLCYRRMFKLNRKRKIICRVAALQKYVKSFWNQIVGCCIGYKSIKYRKLSHHHHSSSITTTTITATPSPSGRAVSATLEDLVALKICVLGDDQIGKTSFLTKYVGKESTSTTGLNQMDKILCVKGARISYTIWEVQGICTAIPVLIGTKFDDFVQLPLDVQWTIANQARAYAKALNATLFFSSATYNINVNKIFKFITAKLFNLPWTMERNLTIGEPIIDF